MSHLASSPGILAALGAAPKRNLVLLGISGLFALAVLGVAVWAIRRFRRQLVKLVREFFSEPGSAFNLAIFRIVFYSAVFPLVGMSEVSVEHFASLPHDLIAVPAGFSPFMGAFPISSTLVQLSYWVLIISSIFATIGFLTRIASVTYLVSVSYFMTIPQLFKVSHDQIVLWVALILAVSRTADVWSVDAVIRARRDARRGRPLVPAPARSYSRPLRLTWLFLALTYVGPGLWKFGATGFQWASPSNMRGILYDKWYELDGWRPFVPIDKSGFLLTIGALMTMSFELSFVLLIWHRATRLVAAFLGVFFHTMTAVTMDITFWSQTALYVSFVDWYRLSRAFFARRRAPLVLCFDGTCGICRTTATSLARIALPGGIDFVAAEDAKTASPLPIDDADLANLQSEIHLLTPGGTLRGFAAYRRIAWRIPVAWPLLPFAYLPPVAWLGQRAYSFVSARRACSVASAPAPDRSSTRRDRLWVVAPTAFAAVILVLGVACIPPQEDHGWPISLYPTFAGLAAQQDQTLVIEETRANGTRTSISLNPCFAWMTSDRYANIVNTAVAHARSGSPEVLHSLLDAAAHGCPSLENGGAVALSFYSETVATAPSVAGTVLSKQLLLKESLVT